MVYRLSFWVLVFLRASPNEWEELGDPIKQMSGPDPDTFFCEMPLKSERFTGKCVDSTQVSESLAFCGTDVKAAGSHVCVPGVSSFSDGWDAADKDSAIKAQFDTIMQGIFKREEKIQVERSSRIRFLGNPECLTAYRMTFCLANFPRCDPSLNKSVSQPIDPRLCAQLMQSCFGTAYNQGMEYCLGFNIPNQLRNESMLVSAAIEKHGDTVFSSFEAQKSLKDTFGHIVDLSKASWWANEYLKSTDDVFQKPLILPKLEF